MIFPALLMTFLAIVLAFYLIYVPLASSIQKNATESRDRISKELEKMFIFLPVQHMYTIKLGLTLLFGLFGFILAYTAKPPMPFVVMGLTGVVGYYFPEIIVHFMAKKRRKDFSEQLVDGLTLIANGMRAGFSLQQAMEMLIEEMPAPICQEFELVIREYKLGIELDQAMMNAVKRTGDEDLDLAVTAILITRKMGGNLAEVFDRIVAMVRDRRLLMGKADALTAQGRFQAMVVAIVPYGFGFMLYKMNPEMMKLMWTTALGFVCLLLVIILDTIGYLWVKRVANVKY